MDTTTATRPESRPLISLFSDLWRETSTLVHDEVELARTELSEKVSQVSSGVTEIAIAGGILFAGLLILLFAASNALTQVLPPELAPWLAPLIVGAVVVLIGLIALARGRSNLAAENLKPGRTLESLRRDRELVKEHIK
jgi:hypothetical protein